MESNSIESIYEEVGQNIVDMVQEILSAERISVHMLQAYVWTVSGAQLRRNGGMNVGVGNWRAPPGGAEIPLALAWLLEHSDQCSPKLLHDAYMHLHPFMDGNGRSGRIVWAHRMLKLGLAATLSDRPFLHEYYYQTLSSGKVDTQSFWTTNGWEFLK